MRYDRSLEGYWYVRTSRPLDTHSIEEGLGHRMQVYLHTKDGKLERVACTFARNNGLAESWFCHDSSFSQGRKSEPTEFEITGEDDGKKMITLRTNYQLVAEAKPPTRGWKRKHKFYVQVWFHSWCNACVLIVINLYLFASRDDTTD